MLVHTSSTNSNGATIGWQSLPVYSCCTFAYAHIPTAVAGASVRPRVACLHVNGCLVHAVALCAAQDVSRFVGAHRALMFFGGSVVTGLGGFGGLGGSFMEAPENTSPDAVSVLSCSRLGTVLLHFAPHVYH